MSTDETTRPSLAGIEQRAAAATVGPWDVLGGGEYVSGPDIVVAPDDGGVTPADAAFIAAARTDVPALTAALREVLAARPNHAPSCRCGACSQHGRTVRAITAHIDVTSPTLHDLTDTRGPRA